ncbi:MAG TPA: RecX family transcriptional regulator [Anaerolineales bacterium]|jgi:regulatory protein|nr:RecX family transcriptional regulator [Anaerolineales bacterium]HJN41648.1 RecX family transcriptional regulator [Anaerolineales bacterium]|tara:strand:+ start:131 stop:760 length:630 start_codon:yes stop_codon:yes gene_type:complete
MGTITALKPQKRARHRVNLYLDGEFAFGLALRHAHDLSVGQPLSASEIAHLRSADEVEKAHEKALCFLEHRPRSEAEVRTRLARHGLPQEVAQAVMQRLRAAKLIDDAVFAAFWVENRCTFRPRGRRALRVELRQKGVSDEEIEAVLEDVDEPAGARLAAEKKALRSQGLPAHERHRKLREFLARRGFEYEIINDVIDELMAETNDNED